MATEVAFAKTFLALLDSKPQKLSPDHVEDRRNYPGTLPYILPRHPNSKPFSKLRRVTPGEAAGPSTASESPADSTTPGPTQKDEKAATVILRSPRNPPLTHTLPAVPLSLSLGELKARAAAELGAPVDKIKVLANKKPVGDTKLLADLVESSGASSSGDGGEVTMELGLMILGGAGVLKPPAAVAGTPPVVTPGGVSPAPEPAAAAAAAAAPEVEAASADVGAPAPPPPPPQPSAASVLGTGAFWDDLGAFLRQRVGDEAVAGEALGVFRGAWDRRAA
ncbi:hypothetical protein VTJ49DRAFT_7091 [Mycothermus thermophilus]|uniref:Ubiquitin-like domain-containing protein n=1 Tax=Humicola insolens TaxID=85995 RepID=A0ABR3VI04_HUMIN